MRHRLLAAAAAAIAWAASAAPGEPLSLPAPGSPAWEEVELPGVERPTAWEALEVEGVGTVFRAEAHCSASS